jgi:hypothetical protein
MPNKLHLSAIGHFGYVTGALQKLELKKARTNDQTKQDHESFIYF